MVPVSVHVVEPGTPGGGMFSMDHPDYLVLNTPCGQHSMYPFPDALEEGRLGMGFYEWAAQRGYRWQDWRCQPAEEGEALTPYDFLPRRVMGEYLEWFYEVLCAEAPAHVTITHHRTAAIDIEPVGESRERVYLADGTDLVVDHVVLTTGHMSPDPNPGEMGALETHAYPIEPYMAASGPHQKVAIEGMGLVALDVLTALTIGLGGHYTEAQGGRLTYHPSGREPQLYLFSRSGYPYCAKSFGAADPMGDYRPAICTVEAVAELKRPGPDGRKRQIDARGELLPLVFAEMELHYYTRAAHIAGGPDEAAAVRESLVEAWYAGEWEAERVAMTERYGRFDASEHFFVGKGRHYTDAADYQAQVYAEVAYDLDEALVAGGASPVKAALETLRALRDTLRFAIEFKGLTLASHVDFLANMQSRFARLVAGPPAFRSQQLMALVDAGLLHLPFGPSPRVEPLADGRFKVSSTKLEHPFEMVVDRLVRGHLDQPSVGRSTSPLVVNLAHRGRVRPLDFDGTPVGSIDINEEFHPLDRHGRPQRRLWVFGVISEGARYFTLYIPSPKSRVRAFVDAEVCARAILGSAAPVAGATSAAAAGVRARVPALDVLGGPLAMVAPGPQGREAGNGHVPAGAQPAADRPLRVALVNNMPDGAFEETERQFFGLLQSGAGAEAEAFTFERYCLPGVVRGPHIKAVIAQLYAELPQLYANPPDALIITGAEPKKADLAEELYWPALERLLRWARSSVPSALVSCLSAHAALWVFDNLPRRLLLDKCSGVFAQHLDADHPLMAGVGDLALPHSRFNEVPTEAVEAAGYRVVARCADGPWTIAAAERGRCQFTLFQGHPEYHALTLLREYRRDVRRYLMGSQGSYPRVPAGYLAPEGEQALEVFAAELDGRMRDPVFMDDFPFETASHLVAADWQAPARALMGNWLALVRQRAAVRLYSETGA